MYVAFYTVILLFKLSCSQSENTTFSTDHINTKPESTSNLIGNPNLPDNSLDESTTNFNGKQPDNS